MKITSNQYTYGRTSVYNLNYHFVWCTKYRNKALSKSVSEDLKQILYDIADEKGFSITQMEIGLDDHIHIMASAHPKYSVTTLISWLKGISARRLLTLHPELKDMYWKSNDRHLWTNSYFVESIGFSNQEVVANYIKNQKRGE